MAEAIPLNLLQHVVKLCWKWNRDTPASNWLVRAIVEVICVIMIIVMDDMLRASRTGHASQSGMRKITC